MENVLRDGYCEPDTPVPQQEDPHMCEGTFKMECCCPQIQTRTFLVPIGPQTEATLAAFLQNTVSAYETNQYMVLGHSLVDTGAGWLLGLTIGWYA